MRRPVKPKEPTFSFLTKPDQLEKYIIKCKEYKHKLDEYYEKYEAWKIWKAQQQMPDKDAAKKEIQKMMELTGLTLDDLTK